MQVGQIMKGRNSISLHLKYVEILTVRNHGKIQKKKKTKGNKIQINDIFLFHIIVKPEQYKCTLTETVQYEVLSSENQNKMNQHLLWSSYLG
jgi:hypothetical protein